VSDVGSSFVEFIHELHERLVPALLDLHFVVEALVHHVVHPPLQVQQLQGELGRVVYKFLTFHYCKSLFINKR